MIWKSNLVALKYFSIYDRIVVEMVVCNIGNTCEDTLSPPNVCCYGCKKGYHAFCIGLPRQAVNSLEEYSKIFHYVCSKCQGKTRVDLIKSYNSLKDTVNSFKDLLTRNDSNMATAVGSFASATDQLAAVTNAVSSNASVFSLDYARMNKLILSLDKKHTDLDVAISNSRVSLEKLNEKFSTLISSVTAFESRLNLSKDINTDIEKVLQEKLQFHCDSLSRHFKTKFESLVTESLANIPSMVESIVNGVNVPLNRLRDDIDSLSMNTSMALTVAGERPSVSSRSVATFTHNSLLHELFAVIDRPSHSRSIEPPPDSNEPNYFLGIAEGMITLLTVHDFDLCLRDATSEISELEIVRHKCTKNPRLKIIEEGVALPKKSNKKSVIIMSPISTHDHEPNVSTPGRFVRAPILKQRKDKLPGRYVRAPLTTINARNPASRSGEWTVSSLVVDKVEMKVRKSRRKQSKIDPMRASSNTHESNDVLRQIYVDGLCNTTTAAEVRRWVQYKLHRDHITCSSLTPRGADPKSFDKLSFKLGVPASLVGIVLSDSFWPAGITAKNFQIKRQERNKRSIMNNP